MNLHTPDSAWFNNQMVSNGMGALDLLFIWIFLVLIISWWLSKWSRLELCVEVRMLVRELEEARGTVVRMEQEDDSMDVTSSSGVITSQLVTFK